MFVVTQDKSDLINVRMTPHITVEGTSIVAGIPREFMVTVGEYSTEERAKEVFSEMLDALFPPTCIVLKNTDLPEGFEETIENWNVPVMVTKTNDGLQDTMVIENAVYQMPKE